MRKLVIEVTEFDYEARCDLRGCLEAAMASEATKMAIRGNMHMDTRVIEVADFKLEVKFDLKFENSNPYNPGIVVHVASNSHFGGL